MVATIQTIMSGVSPEAFGAKGDGTTDDTAAFNAAFAVSRNIHLRWDGVYVVGDLQIPNGGTIDGSAGRDYTSIHTYMLPKLIRKVGCTSIIDAQNQFSVNTYGRACTIRGVVIDGIDNTTNGISGGSVRLNLDHVYITNCNNGIGGTSFEAGASSYTRVLDARGLIVTKCTGVGISNLIDSRLIAPEITQNGIGIKAISGANHWTVLGGRIEFNTNENVRLDASGGAVADKITFVGVEFDRGGKCAIYANNITNLKIIGCSLDRACSLNTGTSGARSNLYFDNSLYIAVDGCNFTHGTDDGGGGIDTPTYAIECNNTVTNLIWVGGDVSQGYITNAINYNSGLDTTHMPGHKIVGVAGVEDYDQTSLKKYDRNGRYYLSKSTLSSALAPTSPGPAGVATFTVNQPLTNVNDRNTNLLIVTVRDATAGGTYTARFTLTVEREAGSAVLRFSPAFGEYSTAGAIAFSGATICTLATSSVAADGSSFTLTATNAHASKTILVRYELQ